MQHIGYFYIMSNAHHTVLYCGATNDLFKRMLEHKNAVYSKSFTSRYNVNKLVYFETYSLIADAFARERQVKAGSRKKKIILIENVNPEWEDLFESIVPGAAEELTKIKKFFK